MAFHEALLPMRLALGATGGPQWRTDIANLASGREIRNSLWSHSRRRWDIGSAITDVTSLRSLIEFFDARSGRLHGFRFHDPLDHSSAPNGESSTFNDQEIGRGDGRQSTFQLCKTHDGESRAIHKPVPGTVTIGIDGVQVDAGWSLEAATGVVTFVSPPPDSSLITSGFQFDYPVRFDTDDLRIVIEALGAGRVIDLSLVELRMEPA